jgi:fatty acid amide hydrolase
MRVLTQPIGDALDITRSSVGEQSLKSFQGLRVGFYTDDRYFRPAPAIRRAVKQAAAALENQGAEVEEFQPPSMEEAFRIYCSLFMADGMRWMRRQIRASKTDWRIQRLLLGAQVPSVFRAALVWANELFGQHYVAQMTSWCLRRRLPVADYWKLLEQQAAYQRRFLDHLKQHRFDVILCPPSALPALRHETFFGNFTGSYTLLYNLLGMPAGVIPITRVKADEETDREPSRDLVNGIARKAERGSAGLPIGVQVIAAYWREDTVLAVMAALEECFRSQQDYPSYPDLFRSHSTDLKGAPPGEGFRNS